MSNLRLVSSVKSDSSSNHRLQAEMEELKQANVDLRELITEQGRFLKSLISSTNIKVAHSFSPKIKFLKTAQLELENELKTVKKLVEVVVNGSGGDNGRQKVDTNSVQLALSNLESRILEISRVVGLNNNREPSNSTIEITELKYEVDDDGPSRNTASSNSTVEITDLKYECGDGEGNDVRHGSELTQFFTQIENFLGPEQVEYVCSLPRPTEQEPGQFGRMIKQESEYLIPTVAIKTEETIPQSYPHAGPVYGDYGTGAYAAGSSFSSANFNYNYRGNNYKYHNSFSGDVQASPPVGMKRIKLSPEWQSNFTVPNYFEQLFQVVAKLLPPSFACSRPQNDAVVDSAVEEILRLIDLANDNGEDLCQKVTGTGTFLHSLLPDFYMLTSKQFHSIVECLVERGIYAIFDIPGLSGETVLHRAVKRLEVSNATLQLLKSTGANFNAVASSSGNPVIFDAIQKDSNSTLIANLVECGADWKAVNEKDESNVLHVAAGPRGNADILKYLLDLGEVPVDATNSVGDTPLHLSVRAYELNNGSTKIKILLANGADLDAKNVEDLTPLQLFKKFNKVDEEVEKLLTKKVKREKETEN